MKYQSLFFILFTLIVTGKTAIAQNKASIKAEIKQATVYLNRAQLTSTATTSIDAGKSEVLIASLPNGIDPQSIQVSGKGNFTILGVSFNQDYQQPHENSLERKKLEDSLSFYEFQLASYKDFEDVMRKEEQMMVANHSIAGKNDALDADDLEYFANFYRKRLLDIRFQILKNTRDIKVMNENTNRIRKQIQTIGNESGPAAKIAITVSAESKVSAAFELSYIVYNAGWYPVYDLKVKEAGEPVAVTYKAMVVQQTGVNWDKVKLTLSTSNPSIGGQKPELSPWYLSVYEESRHYEYKNKKIAPAASRAKVQAEMYESEDREMEPAASVADMTTSVETALAVEYVISIPYTVPSSQAGQMVEIQNLSLPADYKHFAVPKLSSSAYLVALVNGYEDKNLISGKANVYFAGTYVGESYLDLNSTNDTLEVSLGVDKNVVVEREMIKDFRSKKLIGFNKKEEFGYKIKIRNTKKKAIDITVQDQLPISSDSQIKVEINETSNAQVQVGTNMLEWKKTIAPAETLELVTRFTVEYPKSKKIQGLR